MLDGMSDSIQRSRIENLNSREVDRQSPTGLIFIFYLVLVFFLNILVIVLVLVNESPLSRFRFSY